MTQIKMNGTESHSLYVHIPFCAARCTYCAFNTYINVESLIPAYVQALCNELRWLGQATAHPLHTLYFGGGTPSLLSPDQVRTILDSIYTQFAVASDAEITLEANPGTLEASYLDQLRAAGVNRLSLGMQSAHAAELRMVGRQHSAVEVQRSVAMARAAGFDNLSLDLIYGLPGQTLTDWQSTVEAALALQTDHLSMYALILEPGTTLTRQVELGTLPTPDDDLEADMYELADQMAVAAGLPQYEISNWARPGVECAHNLQYWRNLSYLGVGAGAHGYAAGMRYESVKPIPRYIELAAAMHQPLLFPLTATTEHSALIEFSDALTEHMMTGLRLVNEGVSRVGFAKRFGMPIEQVYGAALERLIVRGLLRQVGDRLLLTPAARLLSNQVFLEFIRDTDQV